MSGADVAPARDYLRQLTVLFCDLVGSTELSQRLGPESLRDVLTTYHGICREVVEAHDGHIAQFLGDGVLAYFGYPSSHEDDAQNAVLCGLEILERSASARTAFEALGATPALRLGAHTGRVLVSAISDTRAGAGTLAFGDAPNIAFRIQEVAAPDSFLVSEATWRIVDGYFRGEFASEHPLRGVAEPMRLWRVLAATGVTERVDAAPLLTPFVGRESERSEIGRTWGESLTGHSRFVLVRGDPGIGKSRLVRQVLAELRPPPAQTLYVLNRLANRMSPFRPVIELFEHQLGLSHDADPALRLQQVEKWLGDLGIDDPEDVAALASLLSLEGPPNFTGSAVSPTTRRTRTMDLLLRLLRAIAGSTPTVLVVSDLHWADASTVELLGRIVTAAPDVPLLGLLTARPEFDADWCVPDFVETVELFHLDRVETEQLIGGAAGQRVVTPAVLRQLVHRSGGVPLFAEELTRSVLESAASPQRAGSAWPGPADRTAVPASVAASLTARLDRLGPARSTALLAATIGREFTADLLYQVSELDRARVDDDLQRLFDSGLVILDAAGMNRCLFKHSLLRDAAYSMLPRETRLRYHARVATALREASDAGTFARPDLIAHHMASAGDDEGAIAYWEAAAEQAAARAAHIEAAEHLGEALGSLQRLDRSPDFERRELGIQAKLAPLLMTIYGWGSPEVEKATERVLELARNLGDPFQVCAALWGVWTTQLLNKHLDVTLRAARDVLDVAETVGVPLLELGHGAIAYTMDYRAEFSELLQEAGAALQGFDLGTERMIASVLSLSPAVGVRTVRATALWMLGRIDDADEEWQAMVDLARSLDHPPSLAAALAYALQAELFRNSYMGQLQRLAPLTEELSLLTEEFFFWAAVDKMCQGIVKQIGGQHSAARGDMLEGLALYEQTGARCSSVHMMISCAEAFCRMGDDAAASRLLDSAEMEVATRGELLFSPELWRIRGGILAREGLPQAAEASYLESVNLARAQAASPLELRAALDLHGLLVTRGQGSEALPYLEGALGRIAQASSLPEARRAKDILAGSI